MGVIDEILSATKQAMVLNERVDNIGKTLDRVADQLLDHERRVTRIEAYIDIAKTQMQSNKQLPES